MKNSSMGKYNMNNFMYAMEHSYSVMKTEVDRILKKSDYTTEDEICCGNVSSCNVGLCRTYPE